MINLTWFERVFFSVHCTLIAHVSGTGTDFTASPPVPTGEFPRGYLYSLDW